MFVLFTRCSLCLLALLLLASPTLAIAQRATPTPLEQAMSTGKAAYQAKQYDKALKSFKKALKLQRGKPLFQKAPTYLSIGLVLFQQGFKGLAWKAFEQALYQNVNLTLPANENAEAKAFFQRVKDRVKTRGGVAFQVSAPRAPQASGDGGPLASPLVWGSFCFAALAAAAGIVLVANAGANQADLDTWITNNVNDGQSPATVNASAAPIKDNIAVQSGIGYTALGLAALGVAAGVVLIFLPRPKPTKTASHLPPKAPTTPILSLYATH